MAKTNPIGVRFDIQMLEVFKEDGIADTPQKALNFLAHYYIENKPKLDFKKVFKESRLFDKKEDMVETNIEPEVDESELEKQISAIYAEKIPSERNTPLGRKVWASDQRKRITELESKLKP